MRRWEWVVWADRGKELRSWREGVGDPWILKELLSNEGM
jgi:hypothetical protein